jgi:phospholipase C
MVYCLRSAAAAAANQRGEEDPLPTNHAAAPIEHVFVLMLENHSFDHLLGFAGLTGQDAATGQPTQLNGLRGTESNSYNGFTYTVSQPAYFTMPVDPGHEFPDVVEQLGGPGATYPPGGPYPPINNSGYVANYAAHGGAAAPGTILQCYDTASQLPVLHALAREFAVCDRWYSSLPGPTWPNRFFASAASAGGLDHSPSLLQICEWEIAVPTGFRFEHGTIFDALARRGPHGWRIYRGGFFSIATSLCGVGILNTTPLSQLAADLDRPDYPWAFTWIEPNYGDVENNSYVGGNSGHPMDDITHADALLKSIYETIRNSPHWERSLLIVTWDEHGGFYDHAIPPPAVAPGDRTVAPGNVNHNGFIFDQYGPRVPAVVVSAYTPAHTIDHRVYDHASIPATVEAIFGLAPLTQRDAQANNLTALVSLAQPRSDAPTTLPNPAESGVRSAPAAPPPPHDAPIVRGNLAGFLHLALRTELALAHPLQHAEILGHFRDVRTVGDARGYLHNVHQQMDQLDGVSHPPR